MYTSMKDESAAADIWEPSMWGAVQYMCGAEKCVEPLQLKGGSFVLTEATFL